MPWSSGASDGSTSIDPGTRLGAVHLRVRDLTGAIAFYQGRLGWVLRSVEGRLARIGSADCEILVLHGGAWNPKPPGTTGLFHVAVLFPSRADLGGALVRLLKSGVSLEGAADHGASEALYLQDPEGNGIELTRDRPREEWRFEDGRIQMTSDPLDVDGLVAEAGEVDPDWTVPPTTTIGHIHLQVSDLDLAERFYREGLGFERMTRFGRSASFLSAGGYHHHVGLNVWAGTGAPPPPADAVGLDRFEIVLPDRTALDRALERLRTIGIDPEAKDDGFVLSDPSGIRLELSNALSEGHLSGSLDV